MGGGGVRDILSNIIEYLGMKENTNKKNWTEIENRKSFRLLVKQRKKVEKEELEDR